jgi:hypothetical protein
VRVRSLAAGVLAQLQLTFGLGPELGIVPFRAASLFPKLQGSLLDLLMMGCAERVHGVSSRILARMDPEPRELLGPGACWLKFQQD